jgi:hypothetical protein
MAVRVLTKTACCKLFPQTNMCTHSRILTHAFLKAATEENTILLRGII